MVSSMNICIYRLNQRYASVLLQAKSTWKNQSIHHLSIHHLILFFKHFCSLCAQRLLINQLVMTLH